MNNRLYNEDHKNIVNDIFDVKKKHELLLIINFFLIKIR